MNPQVIIYGFSLFFVCLAAHIVIWRFKTPWVSSLILLVMFLAAPVTVFLLVMVGVGGLLGHMPLSRTELSEVLLLHLSLSCAYIAGYPAVRAVSPTLDILLMISSSKGRRMTEADMKASFAKKRLVTARVDDLKAYRLIRERGDRFEITPAAALVVKVFVAYRKLLGLPAGGG